MELLTTAELARRIQVSPDTIRLWVRDGIIPAIKVTPKTVRFAFADVIRALRSRQEPSSEGAR